MKPVHDISNSKSSRLYYVSWFRVILLLLVVAHHAGQAYGPTGGDWPVIDASSYGPLGLFFSFNASFFMGAFFLLSGYFVFDTLERKGHMSFLNSKLLRLGLPLVLFTVFAFGTVAYFDTNREQNYLEFIAWKYIGEWQITMGHLWFLSVLLVFNLIYLLWRKLNLEFFIKNMRVKVKPTNGTLFIYALLLGMIGGGVRIFYPQDTWVVILGIIPIEPAHFPQYFSLFFIDIWAGQRNWFDDVNLERGLLWGCLGLGSFVGMQSLKFLPSELSDVINILFLRGFLEAFVCVGLILSLLTITRTYFSSRSPFVEWLSAQTYGVYILHVFNVVGLQMALLSLDYPAVVKFVLVTIGAVVSSTLSIAVLRLIPGVRRIL